MRSVTRRYTLELYPTHKQEKLFRQFLGCVRFVYNQCIDHADTAHKEGKRYPGYNGPNGFAALITQLKANPEYSWLKEADSTALQNAAKHADRAFNNMFDKRAKHPKYKTKREHRQSYESTCNHNKDTDTYTIRFTDDKHILLPKVGKVRIRGTVPHFDKLTFATIEHTPSNKWKLSICVNVDLDKCYDEELNEKQKEKLKRKREHGDKITSIDLGIKRYATAFDGLVYEYIENPKYYERQLEKLRREHRKLCRMRNRESKAMKACGIHSRNYEKQRRKVARIYEDITNMRMDTLHKLSRRLVCENQTLIVETLEVKRMLEENDLAGLNRLIADASWGTFIRMLEYKSEETGCILYKVEKDYPSTQMCSNCGYINRDITLAMRRITCPECRETYDRDENAARNLYKRWLNAGNSSA